MADCAQYAEIVQDVVDNRATREQEIYLKRHLKMCLKCLNKLNLDREIKLAVQHRIKKEDVPVGLADSIKKKLAESV